MMWGGWRTKLVLLAGALFGVLGTVAYWVWAELPPPRLLLTFGAESRESSVSGWTQVAVHERKLRA